MIPWGNSPHHRIFITGASGYIGRRLVHAALAEGFQVVAAVRDPRRCPPAKNLQVVSFDLATPTNLEKTLFGVEAVIHLAAIISEDTKPPGVREDLNVSGTRHLLEAARRSGVPRFLFVSSQSAMPDAPTRYGQSKWTIEQMLKGKGEVIVRPGMVSGGPPRGLYGILFHLAKRYPVLPVVRPKAPLYPIHVDDLCAALLILARSRGSLPGIVRVAPSTPMPFGDYVRLLARERVGRRVRLIPIPGFLILAISRITEPVPILPTVSRERIMGLMALGSMQGEPSLSVEGIHIREIAELFATEGLRRRLIAEGKTLTSYVLGDRAPSGVVRRYARAVLAEGISKPLDLPTVAKFWPALLRVFEPLPGKAGSLWRRRCSIATRIVEMTPMAALKFHNYRRRPLLLAVLSLGWTVFVETILFPFRWVGSRLVGPGGEDRHSRPDGSTRDGGA